MKKRMVSLLLTLCMALTLLPATASANYDESTMLYVAGVNVFGGGYWVNDGSGGITSEGADDSHYNVAYLKDSGMLVLNGANIWNSSSARGQRYACIWADGGIKIRLEGENYVGSQDVSVEGYDSAAISAGYTYGSSPKQYAAVTFYGSGSATFQGGTSDKSSCGIYSTWKVEAENSVKVTALGGPCGTRASDGYGGSGSYGVYLDGTSDDNGSVLAINTMTDGGAEVRVGTSYGYKYSYGLYGSVAFSPKASFTGVFEAWCGDATNAAAMRQAPSDMPIGATLAAGESSDGANLTGYNSVMNGSYRYVRTVLGVQPGASVSGRPEAASITPFSITLNPLTVAGTNPGGQVVEYALGATYTSDVPTKGWQTSTTFIGLAPGTDYRVWARAAATAEYAAGPAVNSVIVTERGSVQGLSIDGVEVDKREGNVSWSGKVGGGDAYYDVASRTLTLSGNITISNGYTELSGVVAGIFSNADLNIVLADGADVTIDMMNMTKDETLVNRVYKNKNYYMKGTCYGIFCAGNLTISAAENCAVAPKLTIRVSGDDRTAGIYAQTFGDFGAQIGKITLDLPESTVDVTATQTGIAQVNGIYGLMGAELSCNMLNVAVDGVSNGDFSMAIYGASGKIELKSGTVVAENRSGGKALRYYACWLKELGYTARDENGRLMGVEEEGDYYQVFAPVASRITFTPNSVETLTGTIELTVTGSDDGKLRVGSTITARLINTNAREEELTYEWYWDEVSPNRKSSQTGPSCTVDKSGAGHYLICRVTSAGRLGAIEKKSDMIEISLVPELYVDGVLLTKKNYRQIIPEEKGIASYDFGTNTLTLENANLDTVTTKSSGMAVIESNLELTIMLIGSNSVTLPEGDGHMAVYSKEKLTFTGSGTLNISTNNVTKGNRAAIGTVGDITIDGGCTVEAKSISTVLRTESGNLTVSDGATLAVTSNASKSTLAVYVKNGTTTIRDGAKMTVKVERTASGTNGTGGGLRTNSLLISNGSLAVENIADKNSNAFTGGGYWASPAVYSSSDLTIKNGGELKACSETGWGIATYGVLDVQYGGRMVVSGGNRAIQTGLNDGEIKITAPVSMVYADKDTITGENASRVANPTQYTYKSNKYIRVETKFAPQLTAALQGGELAVTLSTDGGIGEAVLVAAHYDANGKLLAVKSVDIAAGTTTKSEAVPFDMTAGDSYKVFLLDANGAPLCAAAAGTIS